MDEVDDVDGPPFLAPQTGTESLHASGIRDSLIRAKQWEAQDMLAELWRIRWLFWWQMPLLGLIPLVVFLGGGGLLYLGGRFIARSAKATYLRSAATYLLSSLAAVVVYAIVWTASATALGPVGAMLGVLFGGAGALLVSWVIIMGLFSVSFGRAILAWLPTLGTGLLVVPLVAATLVPTLQRGKVLTNRKVCMSNLASIGKALVLYQAVNDNQMPPNFDALIADGQPPKLFVCPSVNPSRRPSGRRFDYFYMPLGVARVNDPYNRLVACDFRANHGGDQRNWLTAGQSVMVMEGTEADFQSLLARPVNADFAAALRAAEGP